MFAAIVHKSKLDPAGCTTEDAQWWASPGDQLFRKSSDAGGVDAGGAMVWNGDTHT